MQYMNLHLYSDIKPFEVVRRISDKTLEIREMTAILDSDFKPEIEAGGFVGHCTNQREQRYSYKPNENATIIRCRLTKKGWKSVCGTHKPSENPKRFYDYNF